MKFYNNQPRVEKVISNFSKYSNFLVGTCTYIKMKELPWPSGYELRLSLERSRVLILVKVIGGWQEGHPGPKMLTAPAKSPN